MPGPVRHTLQAPVSFGPSASAYSFNADFDVPDESVGAIFFLEVGTMAGTTPLLDFKLQYINPETGTAVDVAGASVVQITAATLRVMTVDPRIVAAANTKITQPLSSMMRAVVTIDNTTHDETYADLSLAVEFCK